MPEAHLRGVEGIVEKQLTTALVLLGFVLWLVEERMEKKKQRKKKQTLFVFIWVVVNVITLVLVVRRAIE